MVVQISARPADICAAQWPSTMHTVTVRHVTAARAMELNHAVQQAGLIRGQDYTWTYIPAAYDNFSAYASRVEFHFEQSSMATFFAIKWSAADTYRHES